MPDGNEALLRELLAGQAAMTARFDAMAERVESASLDAREARDLGNKIATKLEEQNIIERFAEHRAENRQVIEAIRTDFAAAYSKVRADFSGLEKRLEVLEADRNKVIGVKSFLDWLARHAPWLLAALGMFLAGVGFDKSRFGG